MATILVVDDSAIDRTLIGSLLSRQTDWRVEFANDGLEAIELLKQKLAADQLPDIVVTDVQMPRLDGHGLVKQIRQTMPHLPVLLVTSEGSEQIAIDSLRAGATSYSPKSLLKSDLVRTASQIIEMGSYMKYAHDTQVFPEPKQLAFVLENESSLIGPAIEHMAEHLPGWSDRDRWQFAMALDEALVNAMHHGNLEVDSSLRDCENGTDYYETIRCRKSQSPFCHRRVRVEAEFSEQHVCVQISDDGSGFDPSKIGDPTLESNLHRVHGRGLFLIRSFMDQVAHNQVGNQITMTKLRKVT